MDMRFFKFLAIHAFACVAIHTIEGTIGPAQIRRESMIFVIAGPYSNATSLCSNYSEVFCYTYFFIDTIELPSRHDVRQDAVHFQSIVWNNFRSVNMYSLKTFDKPRGCCSSQVQNFMNVAYRTGMSPETYWSRVTNFSEGKQLTYLKSVYDPDSCMNLITHLGFGHGNFQFGDHASADMQVRDGLYFQPDYGILTPAPDSTWHIFSKYFISTQLTYEWFKYTFICKEQAWICAPNNTYSDATQENQVETRNFSLFAERH
ncbi:uncharacterized protein LOC142339922 [Convolutriloba macropyga]|uniref:uncharacterized protein LOC142339922 n=1 Tax=Convolutriloba macropyga TaxID=536237 RepID=UPI003F51ADE6